MDTLYVYGPGGPAAAMRESAEVFSERMPFYVSIIAGPEANWIDHAKSKADIIYGGAEYMLTQFIMQHPGLINSHTRTSLYNRAAAILVRPGNPKNISTLADLTKPGVRILDVNGAGQLGLWEDLAGKQDLIPGIQQNIYKSFPNAALANDAWKKDKTYDAMITYKSWHIRLRDTTQLVEIPDALKVYRGTPIAITTISEMNDQAQLFIDFLHSAEGHEIFKKWGWD